MFRTDTRTLINLILASSYWSVTPPSLLFSLHTHSVWETICDAMASRVWQNFCSFCQEYPVLGKAHPRFPPPPPHLPPRKWKLARTWHFEFWVVKSAVECGLIAVSPKDTVSLNPVRNLHRKIPVLGGKFSSVFIDGWWRVTLAIAFAFLPQNFRKVKGTYDWYFYNLWVRFE